MRPRIALLLAVLAAALPGAAHSQILPTGFAFELAVGPPFASEPSAFAFLSDGRIFLTERFSANVRLAAVGATSSALILTIPNVSVLSERGLLGVAVDPEWPTRPYVYFSYTRTDGQSILAMYTASGALTNPASTSITLSSPFVLLQTPDLLDNHNGGTVRFGLDGMLYASWGDDGTPCNGQDLTALNGKIVRLDVSGMPGAGSGPPPKADVTPADNPFVADPNENARLVYVWGLRNPFRFTFDPSTGDLFLGDAGAQAWEEVDRVPAAGGSGSNYGWPILEGPASPGFGLTCGQNNTFTPPIHYYAHVGALPSAVLGGPLYRAVTPTAVSLPPSYDGSYFLYDWGGNWIRRLVLGPTGWEVAPAVPGQPSADHWGEDFAFLADFQEGPDGALYVMKHGGAWGLYRIRRTLPTSVEVDAGSSAAALHVEVRPNPAQAGHTVEFAWQSPVTGSVALRVFDAAGRLVTELRGASGTNRLNWTGRDVTNAAPPAGVYFYRLRTTDGAEASGRVTLLR